MDPSRFGVKRLGAHHNVMKKDKDVGIREGRINFGEISSAFATSGVQACTMRVALFEEVVEVPVVHVWHHDPEAVRVLNV